jgi:hypothetical protein
MPFRKPRCSAVWGRALDAVENISGGFRSRPSLPFPASTGYPAARRFA